MIAVDTNLVVRYLTKDDPVQYQYQRSAELFASEELFLPDTVILETEWVLRYIYGFTAEEIIGSLRKLLGLPNVFLKDAAVVAKALDWQAQGFDFADAFHLALSSHCQRLLTFDRLFARRSRHIAPPVAGLLE